MTHHFGVLVPSTNTTVEIEYGRLLPLSLQVHVGRIPLLASGAETMPRGDDADVDRQARLLGDARVEVIALAQTAASLSADDYDERITKRMSEASGVPAITSARAIGLAAQALGVRRIALVAPYPRPTVERLARHFEIKYGLEIVTNASFSSSDSVIFPTLGPGLAREAIMQADRKEIEAIVVPGGNFPTMPWIAEWEHAAGKPVITTNQAALWAMLGIMRVGEKLPGFGRLLEEVAAS